MQDQMTDVLALVGRNSGVLVDGVDDASLKWSVHWIFFAPHC